MIENQSKIMSEKVKNGEIKLGIGFKTGWFFSKKMKTKFYYMSSYELERMKFLENNELVISYTKKHGIALEYEDKEGNKKNYIPDFLVTLSDGKVFLEEIKGYIRDEFVFNQKNKSAKKYCKNNNMTYRVLYKNNIHDL